MKKYLKRLLSIILVLAQITFCIGCTPPRFDSANKFSNLLISSNVLFAISGINGKGESIERDAYGRELFKYYIYPGGYEPICNELCVYIISQRQTLTNILYYEDFCFILSDSFNKFTQDDIDALKNKNDWGNPFVLEKCSERSKGIPSSEFEYPQAKETIKQIITKYIDKNCELMYYIGMDKDKDGNILIVFQAKKDDEETRNYMIILTSRGLPRGKECFAEIEDLYNYQEQLHDLKIANDWNFS